MPTMELLPIAVLPNVGTLPPLGGLDVGYGTVGTFGDGSLTDDSDSTGLQFGAWQTSDGTYMVERVSLDFAVPAGITPSALAMKMRAENDADVLTAPFGESGRRWPYRITNLSTGGIVDEAYNFTLGIDSRLWDPSVTAPEWFTFYRSGYDLDPTNPTFAGGWMEFGPDDDPFFPGSPRAGLMGDGLRVTFGWQWEGDSAAYDIRRAWLDVHEFRLLVAYDSAPTIYGIPPLRQRKRGDGLGMSGAPRAIQNNSRQASLRQFGFQ